MSGHIGKRRHPIVIEHDASTEQDSAGGFVEDWQPLFERARWGAINPGRGREFESAKAQHAELTHVVTLRYESAIDTAWRQSNIRLKYGERIFNVLTLVNKDERDRELLIYCEELIT